MSPDERAYLEKALRQSHRWGKMTFGQIMDTLDKQYDALIAIRDDESVPAFIRTIAKAALF